MSIFFPGSHFFRYSLLTCFLCCSFRILPLCHFCNMDIIFFHKPFFHPHSFFYNTMFVLFCQLYCDTTFSVIFPLKIHWSFKKIFTDKLLIFHDTFTSFLSVSYFSFYFINNLFTRSKTLKKFQKRLDFSKEIC